MLKILKKQNIEFEIDDDDDYLCKSPQLGRDGIIYVRFRVNGKPVRHALHRLILGNPVGMQVDHIDRNRMNNRKSNLRVCTASQNTCNRSRPKKQLKSNYRGVAFYDRNLKKRYQARIKINGVRIYGPYFETEIEAAKHYDTMAKQYHGEFAVFNFQ